MKSPRGGASILDVGVPYMKHFLRLALVQWCATVALCMAFGNAAALSRVTLMAPTGQSTNDFLGTSVSSAGDVNGDGYADLIVGADHSDAGGADAGRAYVYFGGPGADAVADLTLTGAAAGDLFGHSVASAGDVNGD